MTWELVQRFPVQRKGAAELLMVIDFLFYVQCLNHRANLKGVVAGSFPPTFLATMDQVRTVRDALMCFGIAN